MLWRGKKITELDASELLEARDALTQMRTIFEDRVSNVPENSSYRLPPKTTVSENFEQLENVIADEIDSRDINLPENLVSGIVTPPSNEFFYLRKLKNYRI